MSKITVKISLSQQSIEKLRVLAARSGFSISDFLAQQIETLVCTEESTYEWTQDQAMQFLDHGFHLGGAIRPSRDELHER